MSANLPKTISQKLRSEKRTYSWVPWVIFRNVPLNFANKVSTHVSSLSVDTSTNSSE